MYQFLELIRTKRPYHKRLSITTNRANTVAIQKKLFTLGYSWSSVQGAIPDALDIALYENGDLYYNADHEPDTSIDGDPFLKLFKPLQHTRRPRS